MTSLKLEDKLQGAAKHSPIQYRSDIDGLRAVAVISVVLFHAFPSLLAGGFVGVDIFFVISGFLISSILIKELQVEKFSIANFYSRRVARIFPALITVMIACLLFGWFALLGDEYKLLAKHSIAGAGFVSNLVLWSETSYFDVTADTKPLLHLWSLGVEEQFYFVWPLLLLAIWRLRLHLPTAIGLLIAVSLVLNICQSVNNPTADFYSPQTRFWELLAGALLSCLAERCSPSARLANVMSLAGAALIVLGLLTITSDHAFPGELALIPVCGAALLISAGARGVVNRTLLSNRLMVLVGLISYPLYLWHWPLLSFVRIIESETPAIYVRALAVIAAIAFAWATYQFVEKPVRAIGSGSKTKTPGLVLLMLLTVMASIAIYVNEGFSSRVGATPVAKFSNDIGRDPYIIYMNTKFSKCSNQKLKELSSLDPVYGYRCFQSQPNTQIDTLIIGDSHAEHLLPGMADQLKGVNVGAFTQLELPGVDSPQFTQALELISQDRHIKTIIISALWTDKIKPGVKDPELSITKTLKMLLDSGKSVYLFGDIPVFSFSPEKCKYGRRFSLSDNNCEMPLQEHIKEKSYYLGILMDSIKAASRARFVPVDQFFCSEKTCSMANKNDLLYRDPIHLNVDGSMYLAKMLVGSGAFNP